MDRGRQLGSVRRPIPGTGAYAPIPPVFGPSSPSNARLKSCGGQERYRAPPVADREERHLGTFEELLDDDVAADPAQRAQRLVDLGLRPADEDPLPGREPVGLDDAGRTRDRQPTCGRDSGGGHHLLRERLRAFDPRRSRARPEDQEPEPSKRVGEPEHERQLRPYDDELDAERAREAENPLGVVGTDRMALGVFAIPGLPGAACSSVRLGDWASFQASACSRPPEPTMRTRTEGVYEGHTPVMRAGPLAARPSARQRSVSTRSRAAPVPTSVTGTSSASSTKRTYSRAAPGRSSSIGAVPAGEHLEDGSAVMEVGLVCGEVLGLRAVRQAIPQAHRELGEGRRARRAWSARAT